MTRASPAVPHRRRRRGPGLRAVGLALGALVLAGACSDAADDDGSADLAPTSSTSQAPSTPPTTGEVGPAGPQVGTSLPARPAPVCRDDGPTGELVVAAGPTGLQATSVADGADVDLGLDDSTGPVAPDDLSALVAALANSARTVRITIPDDAGPHPVLLEFHGYGGNAVQQMAYSGLSARGADAGYVAIALDGRERTRRWELTNTDPDPAAVAHSDVAVVDALLDVLLGPVCGDPDHIHAAGLSNGAVFSAVLACASRHDIAAVGAVAFTTGTAGCGPDQQVPTVAFHGTADLVVPYSGGNAALIRLALGWTLEPADEAMAAKAQLNGCEGFDDEPVGADVVRRSWRDCDAETVFFRIEDGAHGWPGPDPLRSGPARTTATVDATELIIEFFDRN